MTTYRDRRCQCDDCQKTFQVCVSDDGVILVSRGVYREWPPACPYCEPQEALPFTGMPQYVKGHHSKTLDMVQKMAETELGMTDIRDNQYAGVDNATIMPAPPGAREVQAQMQQQAEIAQSMSVQAANAVANLTGGVRPAGWMQGGNVSQPMPQTESAKENTAFIEQASAQLKNRPMGHAVSQNYTG